MTDLEKVKQSLEELRTCPASEIYKYFSSAVNLFKFLPNEDKKIFSQSFYQWAKENAERNPLKYSYAEFFLGLNDHLNDEHETALQWLASSRRHFEKLQNTEGVGLCATLTGSIYRTFGNFDLALKSLWEGYSLLKQSGNYWTMMSGGTNSIANINFEMHNYDEAKKMFTVTYEESEKQDDCYFMIYALHGLGKVSIRQNKYDEANTFLEKALTLAEKISSPLSISNSLTELANFHYHTGAFAKAEELNKQALSMREEHNLTGGAVTNCINLGEIYIKLAKWEEALQILSKGLLMAEKIKVKPKIFQVHLLLSEVYQSKNELEKSIVHFKRFHKVREQVEHEDNARKLTDAKLIFEAEQIQKENIIIKKQKEEIQEKNSELQQTIDELTRAKIGKKAKAMTLVLAIILFIFEDHIIGFALKLLSSDNYWLSLFLKMGIIFSLSPINRAIEKYLLKNVVRNKNELTSLTGTDIAPA